MIFFISDLHLAPTTPGANALFLDFLAGHARSAGQLFILGDLFDAWPGDDVLDDPTTPLFAAIADALRKLTAAGTGVSLLHGNRDFLLGEAFARRSGGRLLPDPYILSLPSWQFVLSHGDALCTGDQDYQRFRALVRSTGWQSDFLALPLAERQAIAAGLREKSASAKREKTVELMDVDPLTTDDFLRSNGYATLIHGHTHRPARHDHVVDGIHVERWVLADWSEKRGECLCWNGERLVRQSIP
ncbi:MAG: UDP-2,3-diacylglucosamine diphosphatase [Candidatus Accumulibacter sp.]|nr:UDP-2,3-diacylglucosamine diphosphatase [Accumulibacter sp.]